jgi:hypothetical protein
MIRQRFVITALFATLLLQGAARAGEPGAPPVAAGDRARAAPESEPAAPTGDYAQREARSRELESFQGGEHEHIYIGSTVVVVLLVVLVVVLVL